MSESFEGKKLLILGANPETISIVETANQMGIKTFVTSNRPNDPAKKYAWKSCDVDGMNVPGLVNLVREEKIDGVMVGVADMLVPIYAEVCEILNLPCCATKKIADVFAHKDFFKATCKKFGISGIPEFYLDEFLSEKDIAKISFPVMIKPSDSSGGTGMTAVYDKSELKAGVEKALSVSKNKNFLVEEYMQCDDMGLYYTFKDGYCSASCVYDRYTTDEQPGLSRVCLGGTYPSKHLDEYFSKVHDKLIRMFREIGIRNGVLMLSAFYRDGEFYFYDTGFRLQGEAPHILLKKIHGFDQTEMLIRFALTGSEGEFDLRKVDDVRLRGKFAATLWFVAKSGKIFKIEGFENLSGDSRVAANVQRLYEGDEILPEYVGTEKQVVSRMYLVCENKSELADALKHYMNTVKVFDAEGKNLLLKGFDVDKALELNFSGE